MLVHRNAELLGSLGVADRIVEAEAERDQAEAYRDYIGDMLSELAELAREHGDQRLAVTLQLAAVDAARPSPSRRTG